MLIELVGFALSRQRGPRKFSGGVDALLNEYMAKKKA